MTPEERSLLERTHKLAEENNAILRSLRRHHRVSTIVRILYWVAIIVLSLGAYYLIQPYIDTLADAYSQMEGTLQSLKDL